MGAESEAFDGRTELPTYFAKHAANVIGLDTPPETLEEWWSAVLEQYSENYLSVGLTDLYSDEPTRHEVNVDGRIRYTHCALDALEAAVIEAQDTVTVRSIDPMTGAPVTFTVSDDAVEPSPEGALICFGSNVTADEVEAAGSLAEWSLQDDKDQIRLGVCQYTNASESEETYEQWASETGSVSAPLPPENVVPLLKKLPQDRN